jgi:hypothetical protein
MTSTALVRAMLAGSGPNRTPGRSTRVGLHLFAHGEAEKWLPAREVHGLRDSRRLADVDDDHALDVLDREGIDRKRLGPLAVELCVHLTEAAVTHAFPPLRREGNVPLRRQRGRPPPRSA